MDQSLKPVIQAQLVSLETLLNYLEERGQLGAKEYLYCQAKLNDVVKELKRLERLASTT